MMEPPTGEYHHSLHVRHVFHFSHQQVDYSWVTHKVESNKNTFGEIKWTWLYLLTLYGEHYEVK